MADSEQDDSQGRVLPSAAPRDALEHVVRGPIETLDLDLESVEVVGGGAGRTLKVSVDTDGGVDIDRIAQVSRAISAALDSSQAMGDRPYLLEVSSRGLDAPLTAPRHWRRSIGRLVRIKVDAGEVITGRILSCDHTSVDLRLESQDRPVRFDDIESAYVVAELKKPKEA